MIVVSGKGGLDRPLLSAMLMAVCSRESSLSWAITICSANGFSLTIVNESGG